jgi:hypothetical protein
MPNHLVQIISQPYKLGMDEAGGIAFAVLHGRKVVMPIEENGPTEVDRTHPDGLGPPLDAFKLGFREAQIELFIPRFRLAWPAHVCFPWQSACVLGFGGHFCGPQRDPFA